MVLIESNIFILATQFFRSRLFHSHLQTAMKKIYCMMLPIDNEHSCFVVDDLDLSHPLPVLVMSVSIQI